MKSTLKTIYLSVFLLIIFTSCDYYDARLQIVNKTNKAICFDIQHDTVLKYPDINHKEYYLSEKISSGETKNCFLPGATDAWEQFIYDSKDSTMSLFIFDVDTVLKFNWDTIRKYNKYIKRYDLKVESLKKSNWTITFR